MENFRLKQLKKAHGRKLKSGLGWIFNLNLDCYVDMPYKKHVLVHLELNQDFVLLAMASLPMQLNFNDNLT